MRQNWESPTLLFSLIDEWGSNRLCKSVYIRHIQTLALAGNEKLIDFGSGSGAGSRHLAEALRAGGGHLTCVDTSRYWMAKARRRMEKFQNVSFYNGSITQSNLPEKSFDGIYIFYALHEVEEKERGAVVKTFYRLLKPEGRVYITEPQRKYDGMPIEEIRALMAVNGFEENSSRKKGKTFSAVYVKRHHPPEK